MKLLAMMAASAALLISSQANATIYAINLLENIGQDFSFDLNTALDTYDSADGITNFANVTVNDSNGFSHNSYVENIAVGAGSLNGGLFSDFISPLSSSFGSDITFAAGPSGGVDVSDDQGLFYTSHVVSGAPEPSVWLLMMAGVGGIGLTFRRSSAVVSRLQQA